MVLALTQSIFTTPRLGHYMHKDGVNNEMKNEHTESESKSESIHDNDGNLTASVTADLLQRITEKDADALTTLYDTHAALLMTVIMSVLKDKAESEDILQDSFIAIYNKANMYSPHLGKPINWMATIARNKAYDRYRKLVRRSQAMDGLKQEFAVREGVTEHSPKTPSEELLSGVAKLSADQRAAIELVFYEGLTQMEVAENLNTPLGTVKARIRRGLLKLKQYITNK